jgi:hypothetical protein
MLNSQFERLLKLAQKTGDRLIVTDPSGQEPVVILPLSEYEGLLDHGSFRGGREPQDVEERSYEDVPKSAPEAREEIGESEMEGEFDPEALEEQVMAAMVMEEPEVLPVVPLAPPSYEPERRSIPPKSAGGETEEQFYLEPV